MTQAWRCTVWPPGKVCAGRMWQVTKVDLSWAAILDFVLVFFLGGYLIAALTGGTLFQRLFGLVGKLG